MRLPTSSRAPLSRRTRFFLVIAVSASALLGGTLAAVAATGHPAAPAAPASPASPRSERSGSTGLSTVHFLPRSDDGAGGRDVLPVLYR